MTKIGKWRWRQREVISMAFKKVWDGLGELVEDAAQKKDKTLERKLLRVDDDVHKLYRKVTKVTRRDF